MGFLVLAVLIGVSKLPRILGGNLHGGMAQVWSNRTLRFGALAIFVYVGSEVAIGSYMVGYGLELGVGGIIRETPWLASMAGVAAGISGKTLAGMDAKGLIGALLTFYWGGAMIGRFVGSALMQKIEPSRLLAIFALGAVTLIAVSIASSGVVALLSLIGVGLFNSIMFPTIFTLGIGELGDLKPLGSGILCTAIVGGAFIPPAVGALADGFGFSVALILPILCYLYIQFFARRAVRLPNDR
jgi:FHS family L-fucose permease-like MFS transporter